jgi:hypothetical protein
MENVELDRVKSLEMLRELQVEHKSIKNNPELVEIQQKVFRHKKKEENHRYKQIQDQDQIQELRQKFQNALNKLNSIDTRQVALKEAQNLIKSRNSLESLKIYISSLTDHRKSKDSSAREMEVSLLGYLSEVYKENLVEEGNSLKLLIRLAEVVQSYFKDLNRGVHRAAGTALCDMYRYSLPKSTQAVIFSFMFDPLQSILTTGIDVQVQQAAALTLFIWIEYLKEDNDQGNLVLVYSKLVPLFLKLRAEFVDLLNAIGLLSETCGFQILIENLSSFLSKMNLYLNHPSNNAYPLKTAACQLLGHVGKFLFDTNYKLDPFPSEILSSLRVVKTEKVPVLQNKARETLKIWEILKASLLEMPVEIAPTPKIVKRIEPENHFRSIRNLVKLQKEKMKAAEEKKPENIWGMQKAGFLKKGTGNYFNAVGQNNVSYSRALERRKDFVTEIKKKQFSPEGVKILYKENNRVMQYENEPFAPQMFHHEIFNPDFQINRENHGMFKASQRVLQHRQGEQQNSKFSEKDEKFLDIDKREESENEKNQEKYENQDFPSFHFERSHLPSESINFKEQNKPENNSEELKNPENNFQDLNKLEKNIQDLKRMHKKSLDDKSSCKETDSTEIPGKFPERFEKLEKLIQKNPENSSNFVEDPSKKAELQNPILKSSRIQDDPITKVQSNDHPIESLKISPSENYSISEPLNPDFTLNPSNQKVSSLSQKSKETISRPQNEIQTMKSQTIEIKPLKRRSIIRDLSIQNQEPFKVSKKQKSPEPIKKASLKLEKQSDHQIKGILSKEVQTSNNFQDTPRFSPSLQSEHLETHNTTELLEPIIVNLEEIQEEFEEKFFNIENSLKMMEERISWVDESCKCVKNYRKIKKSLTQGVKTSCKLQQTDPEVKNKDFKEPVDRLTLTWAGVLEMTDQRNVQKAYSTILDTADDLYLLRLMIKTQPCFDELGQSLACKIVSKLLGTLESRFVENIGIQWIVAALQQGVVVGNEVIDGLKSIEMKAGQEAEDARDVLNYLQKF